MDRDYQYQIEAPIGPARNLHAFDFCINRNREKKIKNRYLTTIILHKRVIAVIHHLLKVKHLYRRSNWIKKIFVFCFFCFWVSMEIWWQDALVSEDFRLTKTWYLKCKSIISRNTYKRRVVRLRSQKIIESERFWYFGLIVHKDREIKENVNQRIKEWLMKLSITSEVLYDHRISIKLNENCIKLIYDQYALWYRISSR